MTKVRVALARGLHVDHAYFAFAFADLYVWIVALIETDRSAELCLGDDLRCQYSFFLVDEIDLRIEESHVLSYELDGTSQGVFAALSFRLAEKLRDCIDQLHFACILFAF